MLVDSRPASSYVIIFVRHHHVAVGAFMAASPPGQGSTLLVDESFAAGDSAFVERVRTISSPKYLAALADRWKKDARPWAREQIFRYLELPLDRPGHQPVVKRLFKHAEKTDDAELMGAFLLAFDRLVRRRRRMRYRYDWQTRQSWQEEDLYAPRDQMPGAPNRREFRNPRTGETMPARPAHSPKQGRLFSYATRNYLRRRVSRYFRRLGFQQPSEYPAAVAAALARYRDEDVAAGENILDSWSLLQICFRRSPVLLFKRTRVEVADGASLSGLVAAPRFDHLWKRPDAAAVLLKLLMTAQSRLVRVWAMQLVKRDHSTALQSISSDQLLMLLDHADEEVQQFAAGLMETLSGLDGWPISAWLRLLETRSVSALATICQAMARHVSPQRLTLEQCVELACARATPVARMGLSWLASRPIVQDGERAVLARLAAVECDAVGVEAAQFALRILGVPAHYRTDAVTPFFDSLNAEVRRGAWTWLRPDSPGYNDAALWSRFLETPNEDVRLRLVSALTARTRESKVSTALKTRDFSQVWTSVLLGVHRGGRTKLMALRQISQAIAAEPGRAEQLIPVLTVAIRSVRPPEARAGLSAILSAVAARPELEAMLASYLPELRLLPAETT
jgi:hypothetical protein